MTQKETLQPHISRHHKKWDTTDKKGGGGNRENGQETNSRTYILMTLRSQIYQTGRSIELLLELCNKLSFSSKIGNSEHERIPFCVLLCGTHASTTNTHTAVYYMHTDMRFGQHHPTSYIHPLQHISNTAALAHSIQFHYSHHQQRAGNTFCATLIYTYCT